jgi:molybdenum cofactor cytidylyltransferase
MPSSLAIIPAAGRSERFGGMKLLADIGGEPLLNRTLRSVLEASVERVIVVIAPGVSLSSVALLADHRVRLVTNPDPSRGMFSSIQAGLAADSGDPILILPADIPFVWPATVAALLAQCLRADAPVVPAHARRRGHPIVVPRRLRDALLAANPLVSLKDALTRLNVSPLEIAVEDPGVLRDVDRREDLG